MLTLAVVQRGSSHFAKQWRAVHRHHRAENSLRLPPGVKPGMAALLTPRLRTGGLLNHLYRCLSLNGIYDLTGK